VPIDFLLALPPWPKVLIGHPAPEDFCLRLVGRTKVSCHSGIAFRVPSASRDQLGKLIQLYHQGVGSHGKGPLGNPFGKPGLDDHFFSP